MPKRSVKQLVASIPVIGYIARLASNAVRLPQIHDDIVSNQKQTQSLIKSVQKEQVEPLENRFAQLSQDLSDIRLSQDDLAQKISILETSSWSNNKAKSDNKRQTKELFADDQLLDKFYIDFEDRFRGTEEMIEKRQAEYLPLFKGGEIDFKKTPVLDIGSGRGEFLGLLKKHKVRAIGLDINKDMVERSKKKGLEALEGDALEHLQKAKSQSYGAICGFHIVEHIPFNVLLRILENAHRALAENGFVIFETPNPENVTVGSTTFYMDPSHLHPLPPDLLAFTLETCGFKNIEVKRIHPDEEVDTTGIHKEVARRFFGPRDYAVVAYK